MGNYMFWASNKTTHKPLIARVWHNQVTCTKERGADKPCDYDETKRPAREWHTTTNGETGWGQMSLFNTKQNHYFIAEHAEKQIIRNAKTEAGTDSLPDSLPRYVVGLDF